MNTQKLIEENNDKRELLTSENEKYYSDMMVYIRLGGGLMLSEQQSEEVLMEMLDHLLDGQNEGKTAKEIFGDHPQEYAEEIIQQLPKEKRRTMFAFISKIVVDIVSWLLMINGLIVLVISQFKELGTTVYLFTAVMNAIVIFIGVVLTIWFILRLVKKSLFNENSSDKKDMLKAGVFGGTSFAVMILVGQFIPQIGPTFDFPWWLSLISGAVLWLAMFIIKKIRN